MFESLLVASVMVMTKRQGLLHFDSDYNHFSKGCLGAKDLVGALPNILFLILVTKT